jgi:Kef-type K+ transport system membrane component KefB
MNFTTLAVIGLAGILGPLLALPARWHLPVLLGELLAGIVLGPTMFSALHPTDPGLTFLANMGFALVMFVAGSHVPVRNAGVRSALRVGVLRAVGVGVAAVALGLGISAVFHTGHPALYAVLMTSSSAALVLPIMDSLRLSGPGVLETLAQVAIADTACIVALPLAIDPAHAARAAIGALAVIAVAGVLYVLLARAERSGLRKRMHRISEERKFALELRISLVILFALAAVAVGTHVSIMLAGFAFGLATASVGEPRRLARQLFAIAEGFLAPLFFVWLGASINLRELGQHPSYIVLGIALGLGAFAAHTLTKLVGQPVALAALASAQVGVPVAAATIGSQLHILHPGEAAALLLGALTTIAAAILGGAVASRSPSRQTRSPDDRSTIP